MSDPEAERKRRRKRKKRDPQPDPVPPAPPAPPQPEPEPPAPQPGPPTPDPGPEPEPQPPAPPPPPPPPPAAEAHWARGRTVPVLDRSGPDWNGAVAAAVERWNAAVPWLRLEHRVEAGGCAEAEGCIVVCAVDLDEGWRGGTVWNAGRDGHNHLGWVRVLLNDRHYRGQYPWPEHPARQALACHELGHALGLPHGDVPNDGCVGAVRDYLSVDPGQQDVDWLARQYERCP